MKLTVFTNTDTAENGPSLDEASATSGYYGGDEPSDQRVRFAFSASVPNIEDRPRFDRDALIEAFYQTMADKPRQTSKRPAAWTEEMFREYAVKQADEIIALAGPDPRDSGLWTVVLDMSPAEAANLAGQMEARAKVHADAPTSSAQLDWDDQKRGRLS